MHDNNLPDYLTGEQLRPIYWAVDDHPEKAAIIEAVAGSGKTTNLIWMMVSLVASGVSNIGYAVFNKKNQVEAEQKINDKGIGGSVNVRTTYSLSFAALRNYMGDDAKKIKINNSKYYFIARNLVSDATKRGLKLDYKLRKMVIKNLKDLFAKIRLEFVSVTNPEAIEKVMIHYGISFPSEVESWILEYALAEMQKLGVQQFQIGQQREIDFTDQIWLPALFKLDKSFYKQFDFLLVDEAQDLNQLQHQILFKSLKEGGKIVAVGDRKQAIYGFAGALDNSLDQMKDEMEKVTGEPVREFALTYNFRCATKILDTVKGIVPHIKAPEGTDEGIVDSVDFQQLQSTLIRGDMILSRVNGPLIGTFFQLISNGVQAIVVGRDVSEMLISYVRKIADMKGFTIDQFIEFSEEYHYQRRHAILERNGGNEEDEAISILADAIECVQIFYTNSLNCTTIECIEQTIDQTFIERPDAKRVSLSSVHRAKGAEAERVFIMWNNPFRDGKIVMPHPKAISPWEQNQEQNLIYVARTRAMKALYFIDGMPPDLEEEEEVVEVPQLPLPVSVQLPLPLPLPQLPLPQPPQLDEPNLSSSEYRQSILKFDF